MKDQIRDEVIANARRLYADERPFVEQACNCEKGAHCSRLIVKALYEGKADTEQQTLAGAIILGDMLRLTRHPRTSRPRLDATLVAVGPGAFSVGKPDRDNLLDEGLVPERVIDSLDLYLRGGITPGGFLTAVLENNLKEAVNLADTSNLLLLPAIVRYVHRHVPSEAWGSQSIVERWLSR